jgi:hypothetical protein
VDSIAALRGGLRRLTTAWGRWVSIVALAASASLSHAAWTHAHGDSDNRGFAKVFTDPATLPAGFADVGQVASGANPVTAPDGTVYIGNLAGELIALHADGTPYWQRRANDNASYGGIYASPVVGADGSVYVISATTVHDYRGGVDVDWNLSYLHKFTASGGWLYSTPFPTRYESLPQCGPTPGRRQRHPTSDVSMALKLSSFQYSTRAPAEKNCASSPSRPCLACLPTRA